MALRNGVKLATRRNRFRGSVCLRLRIRNLRADWEFIMKTMIRGMESTRAMSAGGMRCRVGALRSCPADRFRAGVR